MGTDVAARPRNDPTWLIVLGLALLTAAALGHVLGNGFVNYDDPLYVISNELIRVPLSAASVRWALTATEALNWHPLTWMSLQLDYRLFGLRPWGYHLTSLLLHIGSTLLLFGVLRAMTGAVWRSALVAVLFAAHPLHVESVAWAAERKDVLSGFFWMLTLAAYVGYVRAPSLGRYLLAAWALALGLMAKPMVVTLPCVLLLLDYWPLRRFKSEIRNPESENKARISDFGFRIFEKLPLFALAAVASILTWHAQQSGGAIESLERYPVGVRIENALVCYVRYIGQTLWPSGLTVFYPHPGDSLPTWQPVAAGLFLAVVTGMTVVLRRRIPYLLVGWLWYAGTLVPVIGLVQVGQQAMADRYTYLPLIGLFVAFSWGLGDLVGRWPGLSKGVLAAAIAAVLACAVCSWLQVRNWRSSIALWDHALQVAPDNSTARNQLGLAHLEENGSAAAAEEHLRAAIAMRPGYVRAFANLGMALDRQGKTEEAIGWYRQALAIVPDLPATRNNLGIALAKTGRLDEAIEQLTEAARLAPEFQPNLNRARDAKNRARP